MSPQRITWYGFMILVISTITNLSTAHADTLAPGDIAIVGFNCDEGSTGKFMSFVVLVETSDDTLLTFTDNGMHPDGTFRVGEGITTYTVAAGAAGRVFTIPALDGGFNISTSGDQIFVYQGSVDETGVVLTGTLLWGVNDDGAGIWQDDATSPNTSALPAGLSTHVALPELDNYAYTGPTLGSVVSLLAAIQDAANWTGNDTEVPTPPLSFTITTGAVSGTACSTNDECASGFCNDGVCCSSSCLNDTHDCQACSVSAGAAVNGTCSILPNTVTCREASGVCDVAEMCNGSSVACPTNTFRASGFPCEDGDLCNGDESCNASGSCMPGASLDCDDDDECTTDSCDAATGCMSTSIPACGLDAGAPVDAGSDAGSTDDAGPDTDAGPGSDAGADIDAGAGHDAGTFVPVPNRRSSGCTTAPGTSSPIQYSIAFALAGLVLLLARRRQAKRHDH